MKKMIGISSTTDRNANWIRTTERVKDDPKKIWNLACTLKGKSSKPVYSLPYGITTDQGKADLMATSLPKQTVHTDANDRHMIDDADVETSMVEIQSILKSFRPLKFPGIPNLCLKQLPNIAIKMFCDTFNYCLFTGYWPTSFKYAMCTSNCRQFLHKMGNKNQHRQNTRLLFPARRQEKTMADCPSSIQR